MNPPARCRILLVLALACAAPVAARAFERPPAGVRDVPWKIHQDAAANYPPRQMRLGVKHGEARVRLSISASGELLDALVFAYSARDFGEEALRTVKKWHYEPAWIDGEPIGVVSDVVFAFEVTGPVAVEKRSLGLSDEPAGVRGPLAYHAATLQTIDALPTRIQVANPVYPQEWRDRGIRGKATVQFYIDEQGQVRIPVVMSADHRLLGASAVAAVAKWRFERMTAGGVPALVRAEQVFTFEPENK